jgi:hypothetical protein
MLSKQRWATPTPELELTPELEFFTRSWSGVGVDFLIRNGVGVELPWPGVELEWSWSWHFFPTPIQLRLIS